VNDVSVNDVWRRLLPYAAMAPSGHNTQPWRFRLHERTAELRADASRRLPVVDPDARELVMSCGAALLHLRLAIRHFGLAAGIDIVPDARDPELLARIELAGEIGDSAAEEALFAAIPARRTNRFAFGPEPVSGELCQGLEEAARAEGAWLTPIRAEADRKRVADLIAEGTVVQAASRDLRREMAEWVRANDSGRRDGLRGYSFGHGRFASMFAPLYVRYGSWGETQAAADRELALRAPLLAILGTDGDMTEDWMRAGQALARVLLVAQSHGVSASFFNQPIEVSTLRNGMRVIAAASGYPQLCLRFGRGREVLPTPRRPLEEIVETR
jgi:hypothetical protein